MTYNSYIGTTGREEYDLDRRSRSSVASSKESRITILWPKVCKYRTLPTQAKRSHAFHEVKYSNLPYSFAHLLYLHHT